MQTTTNDVVATAAYYYLLSEQLLPRRHLFFLSFRRRFVPLPSMEKGRDAMTRRMSPLGSTDDADVTGGGAKTVKGEIVFIRGFEMQLIKTFYITSCGHLFRRKTS